MAIRLPLYIPHPTRAHFEELIEIVSRNLPEKPDEAFPSVELTTDGPYYPNIWLFTANHIVQIQRPSINNRIQHDLAQFIGLVDWVRLTARNYDFSDIKDNSELDLEFTTTSGVGGTLSACGEGCRQLIDIYHRRFLTNLVGAEDTSQSTH